MIYAVDAVLYVKTLFTQNRKRKAHFAYSVWMISINVHSYKLNLI